MQTSKKSAGDCNTPGSVEPTGTLPLSDELHKLVRKAYELRALLQSMHDLSRSESDAEEALSRLEYLAGLVVDVQSDFADELYSLASRAEKTQRPVKAAEVPA